jgi:hypothetical protein
MSKRHYNRGSNRGHLIQGRRDVNREVDLLTRPIGDFSQEKVIQLFLDRITTASDTEAIRLALALQQFIRGDASLLSNLDDPSVAAVVQKELALAEKTEAYSRKWEEDRAGFIEEMDTMRESHLPAREKRDAVIAAGVKTYQNAQQQATAEKNERRLRFEYEVSNGPKEMIHVVGVPETQIIQGAITQVIQPEIIRVMHKTFVYPPGDHLVPAVIAKRYKEILKGRAENQARRSAMRLNDNHSYNEVERRNAQINQEFGSKREPMPLMEER